MFQAIRFAEVLPVLSGPPRVPSALMIPPSAGKGATGGRVLVKGVCGVDCLRLGPERVLKTARDQKCRSKIGLERKPTPQTPFTMPLEVACPSELLSGRRDLDTGSDASYLGSSDACTGNSFCNNSETSSTVPYPLIVKISAMSFPVMKMIGCWSCRTSSYA